MKLQSPNGITASTSSLQISHTLFIPSTQMASKTKHSVRFINKLHAMLIWRLTWI